ncbi:histidine phosphatase family protein [Nocardioides panacis]|uniref:Histidine phosphatase family protein n=1 Tax=Nocardioides panacis TaxID=2849501 RepID=A0A975SW68_9ACTN|nr:histidine phosphatase family protein [Nocardioides panacis]QWZ07045.1 histidine phosphatase family protein [Nocardioides panacis]
MSTRHTLVLLRHAKSDWSTPGQPDRDRPLSGRGRRQAPEAGRWLAEHGPVPDLVVVSPAVRARRTWDLVAAELPGTPPTRVEDRVYAASPAELLAVLADLPEATATVLLVGHNPGLEELVEHLTGEHVRLPTSALAVLDVPAPWSALGPGAGTLRASGRPPGGV